MQTLWEQSARRRGLAVCGTSKCAVRYFTLALADEAAGTPVLVGSLSPGMMVTRVLTGPMERMRDGEARSLRRLKAGLRCRDLFAQ